MSPAAPRYACSGAQLRIHCSAAAGAPSPESYISQCGRKSLRDWAAGIKKATHPREVFLKTFGGDRITNKRGGTQVPALPPGNPTFPPSPPPAPPGTFCSWAVSSVHSESQRSKLPWKLPGFRTHSTHRAASRRKEGDAISKPPAPGPPPARGSGGSPGVSTTGRAPGNTLPGSLRVAPHRSPHRDARIQGSKASRARPGTPRGSGQPVHASPVAAAAFQGGNPLGAPRAPSGPFPRPGTPGIGGA